MTFIGCLIMMQNQAIVLKWSCLEMKDTHSTWDKKRITNHHDNNIRKWIHRFNEKGIDGIVSKKYIRNAHKITDDIERKIV